MAKSAICLISHYPTKEWMDFLFLFQRYDVYIIVDDNSKNYQEEYGKIYQNINFIQIENDAYKAAGYIDRDFANEIISGWHKALYYFSRICTKHDHVWFFEDDVFFYSEKTLRKIDDEYPDSDLLSQGLTVNEEGPESDVWHWYKITMKYEPPFYNTMVCISRLSRELLSKISDYAYEYKTLFFIEAMFPTLAIKHNLKNDCPKEFYTVYYRNEFDLFKLNKTNLYHPIKRKDIYPILREQIEIKCELDIVEKDITKYLQN